MEELTEQFYFIDLHFSSSCLVGACSKTNEDPSCIARQFSPKKAKTFAVDLLHLFDCFFLIFRYFDAHMFSAMLRKNETPFSLTLLLLSFFFSPRLVSSMLFCSS